LAIAIFIQGSEDGGGIGDFIGVNYAVVVGIQCLDDQGCGGVVSARAGAAKAAGRLVGVLVLRIRGQGGHAEGQHNYHGFTGLSHNSLTFILPGML
jgi:hypothetical protein